tara:strand:+ start:28 stop:600 length:573 start_codon:yes stop_codon:yes gene_type:complete
MITKTDALIWLKENEPSVYYLRESQESLSKDINLRDLGKLFADANEHIQKDWINENTKLDVEVRDDFDDDANASGYDLHTIDGVLKIQSKLRAKILNLEQTRRKSKKNENSSDTGHVRYSVGEADVYLFSRPNIEDYLNIGRWGYIAIPERYLIDKKNPEYLVPRVNKSIWINFVGRAKEILEGEYDRKK